MEFLYAFNASYETEQHPWKATALMDCEWGKYDMVCHSNNGVNRRKLYLGTIFGFHIMLTQNLPSKLLFSHILRIWLQISVFFAIFASLKMT